MSNASDDIPSPRTPPATPAQPVTGAEGERNAPVSRPAISAPTVPGYEIVEEIGRGGHSIAYRAIQQSTGQTVAVKVLHSASDTEFRRLAAEIAALKTLRHPNIVDMSDGGLTDTGQRFYVMDYVAGISIDELWKGPLASEPQKNFGELLRMIQKISEAVQVGHALGIAHGGLGPSNIRVDSAGEPHVMDFGFGSTALDDLLQSRPPLSVTGGFIRFTPYVAPEAQRDNAQERAADPIRSDVYSLGILLYESITRGRSPYPVGQAIGDSLTNVLNNPPRPPSAMVEGGLESRLSGLNMAHGRARVEAIDAIVLKCLARNPVDRYASAGELAIDLEKFLKGKRVAAQEPRTSRVAFVERRFRPPATAPSLEVIKTFYKGLQDRRSLPDWDTLRPDEQTAVTSVVVKAALNLPRAPGEAVQALVFDTQTIAELQRISSLLNDILRAVTGSSTSPPPPIRHGNGGGSDDGDAADDDDDDELRKIWNDLAPEQHAILKFIWKSGDNILTYTIIATQKILLRLDEDRKMRYMSRVTIKKHCRPMELPPLSILHRPGNRSAIRLTSRGRRLLELHVDSKNP